MPTTASGTPLTAVRAPSNQAQRYQQEWLYQAFPAPEARRLLRQLEFHYVPKHASWLNMVEIEIGVLAAQCLDRRIESIAQLTAETAIAAIRSHLQLTTLAFTRDSPGWTSK